MPDDSAAPIPTETATRAMPPPPKNRDLPHRVCRGVVWVSMVFSFTLLVKETVQSSELYVKDA
jgi:hypothetical protein